MKRKPLLLSVSLTALGALLLTWSINEKIRKVSGGKAVHVLVASEDIAAGTPLVESLVGISEVPENYVDPRDLDPQRRDEIIGKVIRHDLVAGSRIVLADVKTDTKEHSLANVIPPGKRAVAISVSASSLPGELIKPGDHVDLMLTPHKANLGSASVLLQNVIVTSIGRSLLSANSRASVDDKSIGLRRRNMTVAVYPDEAKNLIAALQQGVIHVVMRNSADAQEHSSMEAFPTPNAIEARLV